MGPKKKAEQPPPPPPPAPEKNINALLKITTSEGKDFKINLELFSSHSPKIKSLAEGSKDGSIRLDEIDGATMLVIVAYLDLHKEKEPAKIVTPIRSNQSLAHIMEEPDAELIDSILAKGDDHTLKAMDAALLLEMEPFRKRLACGVAIKLMKFTVDELREEYQLEDCGFEEEAMRNSMRPLIEDLKKGGMDEEM